MLRFCLAAILFLAYSPLFAQAELEKDIQTRLIMAEDGDVIELPAQLVFCSNTLWLDAKKNITIRGAGEDKTILSFKNQKQGAEGLKITNSEHITLENFTIEDSKGDLIKSQNVRDITYRSITARWNGKPKSTNGAYALYPVQCQLVRIEKCTAIGASDAGIYVGQSDSVWVTECYAKKNVAGIEIENTTNAWVWKNNALYNTGGILVFDLPDLPKKRGGNVKVYNNKVLDNNQRNFAPKGNIVGEVPAGTGIMILATHDVEVYNNYIFDNRTASTSIVSYYITEIPIKDKAYIPYPAAITIRDNVYSEGKRNPSKKHKIGILLWLKFGKKVPHILYDGIQNPEWTDASGALKHAYRICIKNNQNGTFANLKADKKFKGITKSLTPHDCLNN
jgi:parallel beta-helix repeat protein